MASIDTCRRYKETLVSWNTLKISPTQDTLELVALLKFLIDIHLPAE
jgi:hypothetical protein